MSRDSERVIGMAYWVIGDEMMDIVAALPPSNRQTTAEIGNEHANQRIRNEVMCDTQMAGIMSCKHNLVLSYLADAPSKNHERPTQKRPRKAEDVMYHP